MKEGIGSILSGLANAVGMGTPQTAGLRIPGVISEAGATTAGMRDDAPINVIGDGWHPHKPTILGAIADAYLMSQGMKPGFSINRNQNDMISAMKGFTDNPERAIKRISQIPGMQEKAFDYYNTVDDNRRLQANLDRQNDVFDMKKEELVYNRVASMMGAANESTWSKMRDLAQSVANKYKVDISGLVPEQYDPDSIEYIRQGAIKPKDQERLKQSDRRLDQGDRRLDQGDARLNETNRHNQVTEGQAATNEAGRNARHNNPVARPPAAQASTVMTKYGVGQVSKDKTKMLIKHGDKYYLYLNAGTKNGQTNWVPQGEVVPK